MKPKTSIKIFSIIVTLSFSLIVWNSYSNVLSDTIRILEVNDTTSNIEVEYHHNANRVREEISQLYKKGGLIINFWATWCGACIEEMKSLDSLQKFVGDSIKILSVTYQDDKTVNKFLELNDWAVKSNLYFVLEDTLLKKLFPHNAIPHNIWINKHGVIKAITGKEEVNLSNIQALLSGAGLNVRSKKDNMDFDFRKPMQINDSSIQYRSIFNTHLTDVNVNGLIVSQVNYQKPTMQRFFGFNYNIIQLFWAAYSQQAHPYPNFYLIEILTQDSIKFYYPQQTPGLFKNSKYQSTQEWMEENTYAYELRLSKPVFPDVFFKYVIEDLERNLPVSTRTEKKKRDCIVVKIDAKNRKSIETAKTREPYINIDNDHLIVENATMDDLLQWIIQTTFNYEIGRKEPYINETGINGPINLTIPLNAQLEKTKRLEMIESGLGQLGFRFKMKTKRYPVLIIEDQGGT